MGFLKSLFGGSQSTTPRVPEREMQGKEYRIGDLMYQSTYLAQLETIDSPGGGMARFRLTPYKYQQFLLQFAEEKFVFDGAIGSWVVITSRVERNLTGHIQAALYEQTTSEAKDYFEKWAEEPEMVGTLILAFNDGTPKVSVTKRNTAPGEPYKWSNQHIKDEEAGYNQ
jgi:hypothetical protein